jgi:phosphonate transport system ATP-binding protein
MASHNETASNLVSIRELSVSHPGGIQALLPTTLDFPSGEFTVLLGSSGAGKSSLLRSLNRLNAGTAGDVVHAEIGPLNHRRAIRAARRRTGMVFQQHQLMRRISALSNVLHGRLGHYSVWRTCWPLPRGDRELALRCLDRVGLLDKALVRVDRLSGGEQQRVGIARALAQQPRVLLADEPVASLDPATSHRLMELLREIARQDGMLTIVSLHQVEIAREFADRIIGLRAGRVVFDGGPEELNSAALATIYSERSARLVPEREQHAIAASAA